MKRINFLHLSDLHIGDKYQRGLISQAKKVLFEDIEYILSKIGTLDIIFFTGDLVQKGTKDEYVLVEEFLVDLWALFKRHGQNPYLLCVPGNHDLERVSNVHDATQKVLTNWVNEKNISEDHFWKKPNDYYNFIQERFKNYYEWYKSTSIRKPENIIEGYITGDFYCSMNLNNVNLGIVGLNSTFLQLGGGDVKQKLGVYNKQINLLFREKYFEWLKKQDLSILLTHHSPEWFEPKSLKDFNEEMYTKDTYVEHLCGHMHEPFYSSTSTNGFAPRRLFIAPSLFGLGFVGNGSSVKRIHGYTAGTYNIESSKVTKTIWPRIALQTSSGLKISQNEEFNLEKGSASLTEILKNSEAVPSENNLSVETKSLENVIVKGGNPFRITGKR
jgi:predicted MPP superfamily phosphohydrolase